MYTVLGILFLFLISGKLSTGPSTLPPTLRPRSRRPPEHYGGR